MMLDIIKPLASSHTEKGINTRNGMNYITNMRSIKETVCLASPGYVSTFAQKEHRIDLYRGSHKTVNDETSRFSATWLCDHQHMYVSTS